MPGLGFWDTAEFQMVLPVMGTAHPTGYPTYVLIGWLASVVLQPLGEAALRMNVLSAILVAVGAGVHASTSPGALSGSLVLGIAAGIGIALTPIVWAIGTHADPHALHFALLAIILWLLVRWEQARRATAPATSVVPDRRRRGAPTASCSPRPRSSALSVGNHSLTLLLGPADPPVRPRGRARDPPPPPVHRRLHRGLRDPDGPRPVRDDPARRLVPGARSSTPIPSTWSGFWYVTLGAAVPRLVDRPVGELAEADLATSLAMAADQLGTPGAARRRRVRRDRRPPAALRAPDRRRWS